MGIEENYIYNFWPVLELVDTKVSFPVLWGDYLNLS